MPRTQELVSSSFDEPTGGRLGGGGDKGAAVEPGLVELLGLGVEHSQDLLARVVEPGRGLGQPASGAVVPAGGVGGHQFFLAGKGIVERRLGYPGTLDNTVDADRLDALGIEELVGGSQQPLTGSLPGAFHETGGASPEPGDKPVPEREPADETPELLALSITTLVTQVPATQGQVAPMSAAGSAAWTYGS